VCAVTLAGSNPVPGTSLILRGYGWVVLSTGFDVILALGFASLVSTRGVTNGVLIGWQFIASPLLEHVSILGGARQALYTGALDRLNPAPVLDGGDSGVVVRSVVMSFVVLAAWIGASIAAGGWRTATRDA